MTVVGSTVVTVIMGPPLADIRCRSCKRLLLRWQFGGQAHIEIKCPRCGSIDLIHLSTSI
jgi:phage FluMu protein Com